MQYVKAFALAVHVLPPVVPAQRDRLRAETRRERDREKETEGKK